MAIQTTPLKLSLVIVTLVAAVGGLVFSLWKNGLLDWLIYPKVPMASFSQLADHMPKDRREAAKAVIDATLRLYDSQNDKKAKGYEDGREAVHLFAGYAVAGDLHGEGVMQRASRQAGFARNDGSKDPLVLALPDLIEFYNGRSRTSGDLRAHMERVQALVASGYPAATFFEPVGAALNDLRRFDLARIPAESDYVAEQKQAMLEVGMNALRTVAPDAPAGYVVEQAQDLANRFRRVGIGPPAAQIEAVLTELGVSGADMALFRAEVLIAEAWQIRGYSPTPAQDVVKQMLGKLGEAAAALESAANEYPDDARLAAMMIYAQTGLDRTGTVVNEWFDKAVQIDPKCYEAYERKMVYIQPRWGGTREDVIDFAKQCVATKYWEDNVPLVAVEGLGRMGTADPVLYADNKTWDLFYGTGKQYISKYPASVRVRTQLFIQAVRAGRWSDAYYQYRTLGEHWDRTLLTEGQYERAEAALLKHP